MVREKLLRTLLTECIGPPKLTLSISCGTPLWPGPSVLVQSQSRHLFWTTMLLGWMRMCCGLRTSCGRDKEVFVAGVGWDTVLLPWLETIILLIVPVADYHGAWLEDSADPLSRRGEYSLFLRSADFSLPVTSKSGLTARASSCTRTGSSRRFLLPCARHGPADHPLRSDY